MGEWGTQGNTSYNHGQKHMVVSGLEEGNILRDNDTVQGQQVSEQSRDSFMKRCTKAGCLWVAFFSSSFSPSSLHRV